MSYDLNSPPLLPANVIPISHFTGLKKLPADTCVFSTSALSNLCVLWKTS